MKNLLNLGKALNKAEQRMINGGNNNGCPPPKLKKYDPDEQFECGGDTGLSCEMHEICCYGYCF
ncbi:hypothetical protein [Winogradskyella sp. SYSU M77433]|uniref:hypothetical protein n=1 Tax=Winogradskyella sp. SYSU M77433 TaxID=3042722 RepID=UPI002481701B|nr:hypothetical protein [Winogradskyella sp. SYSU M77433]MDH7914577.1 hypothetical protein [Winogradskyella sp. SYSU M77433]